jgi:two-component system repressor protein LuxO
MSKNKILVIEDTVSNAALYVSYLKNVGYDTDVAETGNKGLSLVNQNSYKAVILDLHLPDIHGLRVLKEIKKNYSEMPVIVITAFGSINQAVESIQLGAFDFITKPFSASRLTTTVDNALIHISLTRELHELRRETQKEQFQGFVGASPAMQAVYRQIEAVASSKASIFISGESGTGKELAAQAIHNLSLRASKPFIAINCAAIPKDLMESQIFGHIKGSFTSAIQSRRGAAALADGGTLFLDEICEMPTEMQAKMLRFIQTGHYTPVGGNCDEKADIRLISATNRPVMAEVEGGRFREDLFYRLHVVPLELPPLREREDDVVMLAEHFLRMYNAEEKKKFRNFDPDVLSTFRNQEWPGNVRQLANLMHHIVVINHGEKISLNMLPEAMHKDTHLVSDSVHPDPLAVRPLWLVEKETIMHALRLCRDDVPRAAAMLEVSPSTIYRKLQLWREKDDSVIQVSFA